MTGATHLDESVLRTLLQQIDGCQVTKLQGYKNVSHKGRLVELDLSGSCVNDMSAKAIAAFCPGLRRLKLAGCTALSDDGMRAVAKFCTGLRELDGAQPRAPFVLRRAECGAPVRSASVPAAVPPTAPSRLRRVTAGCCAVSDCRVTSASLEHLPAACKVVQ
eukprot:3746632-Prymnesium_polylepis.1